MSGSRPESGPREALPRVGHDAELELLFALIADVFEVTHVRALVIKGRSAVQHRLRTRRGCADVDLIAPGSDAARIVQELVERGWRLRVADEDELVFPQHAETLCKPGWSHDIDVHRTFPGIDRSDAFEELWRHRVPLQNCLLLPICTVGLEHAVVIEALHAMRNPRRLGASAALAELRNAAASETSPAAVAAAAAALGAAGATASFIRSVWPHHPLLAPRPPLDWRLRTELADPLARRVYLLASSSGRGARWRLLRSAIAPSRQTLVKSVSPEDAGRVPLWRRRLRRWLRGIRLLPHAVLLAVRFAQSRRREHGHDGGT